MLKRFILWDFKRGSWQYDVIVGLILAFIFLTPREVFRIGQKSFNRHEIELICGNLHAPSLMRRLRSPPARTEGSCSIFWTSVLLLSIPEELRCVKQKSSVRSGPPAIIWTH